MQGQEELEVEVDVMDLLNMGLELGQVSLLERDDSIAEEAEECARGRRGEGGAFLGEGGGREVRRGGDDDCLL